MNKDKLEEYIKNHRDEFDQDSPPPMVWMNIEKSLDREQNKGAVVKQMSTPSIMRIMQIAAMFVVVMGVGLLIGLQINNGNKNALASPQLQEFVEAERHYSNEIDKMWQVVNASSLDEKETIQEDLNALDAVYNELKNELLSNPKADTDYVVNAMIDNYRAKIEILETVLMEYKMEKTNNNLLILDNEKSDI
ncbi:MAG: hypothetical protein AAGA77_19930 [Bacteroidota bacterium]